MHLLRSVILLLLLSACSSSTDLAETEASATALATKVPTKTSSSTPIPSPTSPVDKFTCQEASNLMTDDLILKPLEIPTGDLNIFYWRTVELVDSNAKPEACGSDCSRFVYKEGEAGNGIPQFDLAISLIKWGSETDALEFATTSWQEFASNAVNLDEFDTFAELPETTLAGIDLGNDRLRTYLSTSFGTYSIEIEHSRPTPSELNVDFGSIQWLAELQLRKLAACLEK
jgi:hypothetical protein